MKEVRLHFPDVNNLQKYTNVISTLQKPHGLYMSWHRRDAPWMVKYYGNDIHIMKFGMRGCITPFNYNRECFLQHDQRLSFDIEFNSLGNIRKDVISSYSDELNSNKHACFDNKGNVTFFDNMKNSTAQVAEENNLHLHDGLIQLSTIPDDTLFNLTLEYNKSLHINESTNFWKALLNIAKECHRIVASCGVLNNLR